jgi:predicted amidohydrolase YtcJ
MSRVLHHNFVFGLTGEREEMLVEDGLVIARAARIDAAADAARVDHEGRMIIPPFIDSHCHILPVGLDLMSLNLGESESVEEVLQCVREGRKERGDGWLVAVHYDQNRYGRHLSLRELDDASGPGPALLRHVSGHSAIANSAALRLAGIDHNAADSPGGNFERDSSGNLTGVLLEKAMDAVFERIPKPTVEQLVEAILAAGESMQTYGICCAADMHTGFLDLADELDAYRIAAERGCKIQTRLYLRWSKLFGPRAISSEIFKEKVAAIDATAGQVKIAGVKIFADGAIGSGTAAIYGSYTDASPSDKGYSGQMIYSSNRLDQMVKTATDAGYQVSVHSIGDYCTDKVLDAFEKSGEPSRHRIEHAMLLSDSQVERMARLNCFVNMQPEFLVRFGTTYRSKLGLERAAKIKRFRSVLDAGLRLSLSSDRPIVSGDPRVGIALAVNRPAGFDPVEECTLQEAVAGYTREAAKVNGDSETTLQEGQRADYLVEDNDATRRRKAQ